MPDLMHSLQGQDLSFLRMVANAWGVELTAPDVYTALPLLVQAITEQSAIEDMIETLPVQQVEILEEVARSGGRLPWSRFVRKFGELRSMGAGKRDRERPDLNPASPVESLWYRGLISRAFLRGETDMQEFVYIPDEFLNFLQSHVEDGVIPAGRPASASEAAHPVLVDDRILDDCCTLLAALRTQEPLQNLALKTPLVPLGSFLRSINLIDIDNLPNPEKSRKFLESKRPQALADLVFSWMNSTRFNELRLVPGLVFEGEWTNDPYRTRQEILEMLTHIPEGQWWHLQSFIQSIKENKPDFQRPAGDYDSWFIRRQDSQDYLRGFSSWNEVEGALIRFMICGPLHWLGILDLAGPEGKPVQAFRHSRWSDRLSQAIPPEDIPQENQLIRISSSGAIQVPTLAPRWIRYQVARFGEWEEQKEDNFRYRMTPASLKRAQNQGLLVSHILTILKKGSENHVPPRLVSALERWEKFGVESKINQIFVLRVETPEILDALRKSRAGRYLGETLNPRTVQVSPRGLEILRDVLAENGFLAEMDRKS